MHSHVRKKKTLVFFAPDITDVSTIKRADAFLAHGYHLLMYGFRRSRYNCDFRPTWPYFLLGETQDGRYGQRIAALFKAIPRLFSGRTKLRDASVFYARNIDQLLLALLARRLFNRRESQVIYEVLDIQPAFVGDNWRARCLRAIERFCLYRTNLLVVSSPGFRHHYFEAIQGHRRAWFLLENKLPTDFPLVVGGRPQQQGGATRRGSYRWVVGYCGLIRGQETINLIIRVAERLQGVVLFRFRGVFTTVNRKSLIDAMERLENIVYEGDYVNPRDLSAVYGDVDFAWAIDLENRHNNSRWLLPCRFYEAGYFGVPCLTAAGFEVGRLVEHSKIGWNFDEPYEDAMVRFFLTLTQAEYDETSQRLLNMPSSSFVAGEDIAALMHRIDATEAELQYGIAAE